MRAGRKGEEVWVVECMRDHISYSISLNVHSEADALAELALFERDPVAYKTALAPVAAADAPCIQTDAIMTFIEDKLAPDGDDEPISKGHAKDLLRYLKSWQHALGGKDLRTISVAEYRGHLKVLKPRRQHVSALKSFTRWLRADGRLVSGQDASRDLVTPAMRAKRADRAVGYTMEDFGKLYAAIKTYGHHTVDVQSVRDVLVLRALCGMHHSEIERLAAGERKVRRLTGHGEIAGVITFLHKKGLPHPQSLGAQAMAAAERLQAKGRAPHKQDIHRSMDEAGMVVGLPRMRPGELRHSFITWALTFGREVRAKGAGVSLDLIRRVVGHTSTATTEIYNDAIPPLVVLPLKLENEEDPPLAAQRETA